MHKVKQVLFFLIIFHASLVAQEKMTLQQCVEYGITHNLTLRQMQGEKELLQTDALMIKNSRLPQVNAGMTQRFNIGRSLNRENVYEDINSHITDMNINIEMPLFDGFATRYMLKENKGLIHASEADRHAKTEELRLNISNLFFRAAIYKEICLSAKEQKQLSVEQIQVTKKRIEAGMMSKQVLLELEAQLASDELKITEAKGSIDFALIDLAQLMNYTGDMDDFDIEIGTISDSGSAMDQSSGAGVGLFPQIKAMEYRMESEKWNYKRIKTQVMPVLSLGGSIGSSYYKHSGIANAPFDEQLRNNQQTYIYAALRIPIFDKFNTRNSLRRKNIEIRNQSFALQETKSNLYAEILKAQKELLNAQQKLVAAHKAQKAHEEAFRYAEERFSAGKLSVYELLQARQQLASSQSQSIQAKYETAYKQKVYDYYMQYNL